MNATMITRDATLDDLSAQDYADIFAEIRERMSLDKFCALVGSKYSKAQWGKYEHGEIGLTRIMRNELRRAAKEPELPMTVAEATAQASPDAAVWRVGEGAPEHVIMVTNAPVTLRVNGAVEVVSGMPEVTEVTVPPRSRTRYIRPCIPERYAERLAGLPIGFTWLDVIEAGFRTLEAMP